MYRTMLALMLIPCVLLTQFAAVPHTHGAGSDPHQNQNPHFHFHQFSPATVTRAASPARCCDPGSRAVCARNGDAPADHDADAVYVGTGTAVPERHDTDRAEVPPLAAPVPPLPLDFLVCVVTHSAPPPALAPHDCPRYVRHRALIL